MHDCFTVKQSKELGNRVEEKVKRLKAKQSWETSESRELRGAKRTEKV